MSNIGLNQEFFDILKRYYDESDLESSDAGGPYKNTLIGQFVPSPLLHVHIALTYLVENGLINASGLLLDAGSGDGRIVALASFAHGIPTVGVEYDSELVESSINHIKTLRGLGIHGASESVLLGDFTDPATYKQSGIVFEDFSTIFNYINNESSIAAKIAEESPSGTKFILLGAFPLLEYQGLTLERNLQLDTRNGSSNRVQFANLPISDDVEIDPTHTYMQVYRK